MIILRWLIAKRYHRLAEMIRWDEKLPWSGFIDNNYKNRRWNPEKLKAKARLVSNNVCGGSWRCDRKHSVKSHEFVKALSLLPKPYLGNYPAGCTRAICTRTYSVHAMCTYLLCTCSCVYGRQCGAEQASNSDRRDFPRIMSEISRQIESCFESKL